MYQGPGRREAVEYLDDDDDTEAGAEGGATKSRNVPQAKDPPPKVRTPQVGKLDFFFLF